MVELGIYSTENGSLILENCACFVECYLFLGCGFGESVYSIAYFLQEEEQEYPGRTRLYCHITTLSSITEWILCFVKEVFFFLYSVPFRQCHSHSHRHVQASSTVVSATRTRETEQRYSVKSNRANSINSKHLFFMILVNVVVLLRWSCLFWVSTLWCTDKQTNSMHRQTATPMSKSVKIRHPSKIFFTSF